MRRHARSLIIIMLSLSAGAVVGPLLIAAAAAALGQESDGYGTGREAERLVDAYRDQLPRGHMFLSLAAPPNGEECGYDPEIVLRERSRAMPSNGSPSAYSDYQGYAALNWWRGERRDEAWI